MVRRRGSLLLTVIATGLLVAACGRASPADISRALGITPTATLSAAQIATATSAAAAAASQVAAAALSGSPGAGSPAAVAAGDITRGGQQFTTWCAGCHRANGRGPDILAPGGPGAGLAYPDLEALIRQGTNHTPPGPYATTRITDRQLNDIHAYILSRTGG